MSIERRFITDEKAVAEVLDDFLLRDIQAARLSSAFRAYYRLRSLIPLPLRQLLQRFRQVPATERWCFPDDFVTALSKSLQQSAVAVPAIHPWPNGAAFAFVPTHDVETADGMRRIASIADLEDQLGFRSSWNIVPHKYPVDHGLLRDLRNRGFEIGVHGYNHDGKLFTSKRIFDGRVPAINAALREFGATGFRAPMVHRNLVWMQALEIEYDASCFDADPYQAMPGGVGSPWPFIAGRFVELPYTLPQDHTLFVALNERDGRLWNEKLDFIEKLGGMALLITHPDYLVPGHRLHAYRRLLERVRETAGIWNALPREVAAWWRDRDASTPQQDSNGVWRISGPASNRARASSLQVSAAGEVEWHDLPSATTSSVAIEAPSFA
jgi:peptidoglycan/xylan/chitin deacetylase (PgdA/CDA1 family)